MATGSALTYFQSFTQPSPKPTVFTPSASSSSGSSSGGFSRGMQSQTLRISFSGKRELLTYGPSGSFVSKEELAPQKPVGASSESAPVVAAPATVVSSPVKVEPPKPVPAAEVAGTPIEQVKFFGGSGPRGFADTPKFLQGSKVISESGFGATKQYTVLNREGTQLYQVNAYGQSVGGAQSYTALKFSEPVTTYTYPTAFVDLRGAKQGETVEAFYKPTPQDFARALKPSIVPSRQPREEGASLYLPERFEGQAFKTGFGKEFAAKPIPIEKSNAAKRLEDYIQSEKFGAGFGVEYQKRVESGAGIPVLKENAVTGGFAAGVPVVPIFFADVAAEALKGKPVEAGAAVLATAVAFPFQAGKTIASGNVREISALAGTVALPLAVARAPMAVKLVSRDVGKAVGKIEVPPSRFVAENAALLKRIATGTKEVTAIVPRPRQELAQVKGPQYEVILPVGVEFISRARLVGSGFEARLGEFKQQAQLQFESFPIKFSGTPELVPLKFAEVAVKREILVQKPEGVLTGRQLGFGTLKAEEARAGQFIAETRLLSERFISQPLKQTAREFAGIFQGKESLTYEFPPYKPAQKKSYDFLDFEDVPAMKLDFKVTEQTLTGGIVRKGTFEEKAITSLVPITAVEKKGFVGTLFGEKTRAEFAFDVKDLVQFGITEAKVAKVAPKIREPSFGAGIYQAQQVKTKAFTFEDLKAEITRVVEETGKVPNILGRTIVRQVEIPKTEIKPAAQVVPVVPKSYSKQAYDVPVVSSIPFSVSGVGKSQVGQIPQTLEVAGLRDLPIQKVTPETQLRNLGRELPRAELKTTSLVGQRPAGLSAQSDLIKPADLAITKEASSQLPRISERAISRQAQLTSPPSRPRFLLPRTPKVPRQFRISKNDKAKLEQPLPKTKFKALKFKSGRIKKAPLADLIYKTQVELATRRRASSPSVKTSLKYFAKGLRIPTAQQLK